MIPVIGSKRKDRVSVRGNAKIKRMISVIGSKQNGHEMMPVIGYKQNDRVPVTGNTKNQTNYTCYRV